MMSNVAEKIIKGSHLMPSHTSISKWLGGRNPSNIKKNPFSFQGEPGQRINFTLQDFAIFARNQTKTVASIVHCHVYVIFKEVGGRDEISGRSVTVCGGKQRTQHVYTSSSHEVEVRILGRNRNFIVNYTGTPRYLNFFQTSGEVFWF